MAEVHNLQVEQTLSSQDCNPKLKNTIWGEAMWTINQMMTEMFQHIMHQGQIKEDTSMNQKCDVLQKAMTSLMNLSQDQSLVSDVQTLLEDSYSKSELIFKFPQENTCWCIGNLDYFLQTEHKWLRLMAALDVSTSMPATKLVSIANKTDTSYEDQAMKLFYHTCLHPVRKQPRRPFFIKLCNIPDARDAVLDVEKFGVTFLNCNAMVDLEWNNLSQESHIWFRRCFMCGLQGTPDMFITCPHCKAVLYCDNECQSNSWHSHHKKWCEKLKSFMEMEHQLADLPFTFCPITTSQSFTKQKFINFLQENDVHMKGLWRRECPVIGEQETKMAFGDLLSQQTPYVLPLESAVLESTLSHNPPLLDRPLESWLDYYNYRGFWLDSSIAGLLHYPLTLYWIIVNWLPHHYLSVFKKMKQFNMIHIHIIGAEKEAEMFDPFLECARLLSPIHLHLHLIGDKLSSNVHFKQQNKENLTFHLNSGLYHKFDLPQPDVIVGFNAGLGAYDTFMLTIKIILENKTPLCCTDYCYYSITHSQKSLSRSHIGRMLKPVINPFRSPFRLVAEDMNVPRYSNAFVYGVKKWTPN